MVYEAHEYNLNKIDFI